MWWVIIVVACFLVPQPGSDDPFTQNLSRTFYDGGFEDHMSKSEAARILGVRENASRDRVLERYRTLMKINHPDRGGSPLLSLKVNEAKELLSKTAQKDDGADGGSSSSSRGSSSASSSTGRKPGTRWNKYLSHVNISFPIPLSLSFPCIPAWLLSSTIDF